LSICTLFPYTTLFRSKLGPFLLISMLGIFFACPSEKDHLIKIETRFGDMYAILYDETPAHKENFIRLVEDQRFDSTTFHRVIRRSEEHTSELQSRENL